MYKNIPSRLKVSNRKIVYQILSKKDGMSRADIARMTGISSATVLKIMEYLWQRGIIYYDSKEQTNVIGRKPVPVRFNGNYAYIVAIYMEGRYASIGIVNAAGDVIVSREIEVLDAEIFIKKDLYTYIDSIIAEGVVDKTKLISIGLAIPAAIDPRSKKAMRAPFFYKTKLAALDEIILELGSYYSLPVFVENDINAAAYGEYRSLYSENIRDIIYISLGSGVGGGLILNGAIWRGQNVSAGEFGYMIFDRYSVASQDGLGWLERKINISALQNLFEMDMKKNIQKPLAQKMVRYLSKYISLAILNITAVLDIQTVVLGGITTNYLSDYLIDKIYLEMKAVSEYVPELVYGKLGKPGFAGLSYITVDNLLDKILT